MRSYVFITKLILDSGINKKIPGELLKVSSLQPSTFKQFFIYHPMNIFRSTDNKKAIPFALVKHCFSVLFLSLLTIPLLVTANKIPEEVTQWQFSSEPEQTQVLELFTSEGCSSCPPADRWLSTLKKSPDLWHRVIPIAFHVDYWNSLGWEDPFSSKANSQRQRTYKKQRLVSAVYTPGFVINGQEWRGWFNRSPLPGSSDKNVGVLTMEITNIGQTASFTALFEPADILSTKSRSNLSLNVALLAMNEQTRVRLGENRGKTLHHDFVVTNLQIINQTEKNSHKTNNPTTWQGTLDLSQCQDCAIATWVSERGDQQPIQATGGYLNGYLK